MDTPAFPALDAALTLPGPAGGLEAKIEYPDADAPATGVVAIVCHPLPTEGGTMDNKVVTMTARALRELGHVTVRFNFRGTGASEGAFHGGEGEVEDLRAVARWVAQARPDSTLWLAGFSFGAAVSAQAAATLAPARLISIAPPVMRWGMDDAVVPTMPWLVVMGEQDEVVAPQAVYDWLAQAAPPQLTLIKLPDASHFFHGKLIELREAIKRGLAA